MLVVDMHTRIILVHLNTHFYKVVVLEELVLIPQKIVMKVVMLNIHQHKRVIIQFLAYQMTLCLELP